VTCLLCRLNRAVRSKDDELEVLGMVLEDKVDEAGRGCRQMRPGKI